MITALYLAVMRLVIGKIANSNLLLSFVVMGGIIIFGSVLFRIDEKCIKVSL